MAPPDLSGAFRAIVALSILAGIVIACGLPWMWDAVIKPFLRWLVL